MKGEYNKWLVALNAESHNQDHKYAMTVLVERWCSSMRFILTANGYVPTDGTLGSALFNGIGKKIEESAINIMTDSIINGIEVFATWFADRGLAMLAEGFMIFSLFCFLMAITGQGKWMERGVKAIIGFALIGGAAHAI